MRKMIVAGNWKMNMLQDDARKLVNKVKNKISDYVFSLVDIVFIPPFTAFRSVYECIFDTQFGMGGQDVYYENSGAYTGEISPPMLMDAGCEYVIVGHSERRKYFGETDVMVNKKIKASLENGLKVIVCLGETLEERESGNTFTCVESQLKNGFCEIEGNCFKNIIIAYEPVWAIGTGRTATPETANEVHMFIRQLISEKYGDDIANFLRIQYGGSVKPENALDLFLQPHIDGGLIGGASLKVDAFVSIIQAAVNAAKFK